MKWTQILFFSLLFHSSLAAFCEIFPPSEEADGTENGFIFIPGAQIAGEFYGPLSLKIQSMFPGKMWVGLTEGWFGNFPNPLEIDGAIKDCLSKAQNQGLSTQKVFQAGHSLGGIMLETWAKDNSDLSSGIILFGSYLPNGFFGNGDTNVFPVPVLTAVGSLDGGALSYVRREAREAQDPVLQGQFPVFVIDQVNHAQVASGEIPDIVIEQDVDAEISNEEAFIRYSKAAVAFMVTVKYDDFAPEIVEAQLNILAEYQQFTDEFLAPFEEMKFYEENEQATFSFWASEGQKILANTSEILVTNQLVAFSEIGGVKPQIGGDNCQATIQTFAHNSFPLDPLDFGGLTSADVIKAKFKLEDVVSEKLCQNLAPRRQCAEINAKAMELALSRASQRARERYLNKGRKLTFGEDYVSPWGPGWEFSTGLSYTEIDESTTEVVSTSLISEPDFIISSAAGMHYCDLLSPYRALEWIYIKGVQHGAK